jgi:hypothetical protein
MLTVDLSSWTEEDFRGAEARIFEAMLEASPEDEVNGAWQYNLDEFSDKQLARILMREFGITPQETDFL